MHASTHRLTYRTPLDLDWMLGFLQAHALPGVEHVDATAYARTIGGAGPDDRGGWLRVSAAPDAADALVLELHGVTAARIDDAVRRVRRMFDLDADPAAIAAALSADARLAPLVARHPGLRLPVGWDGVEIAVRAVLGQQVSVAAARTFAARAAIHFGTPLPQHAAVPTLTHVFPTAEALANADLPALAAIGVTRTRTATLQAVARAVCDGTVDFDPGRTLDDHIARWTALPGIGPWTAHYIVLRALGHADAFPADDLVLQKSLPDDGTRMTAKTLDARAVAWRPWRAYATLHLWRDAMSKPRAPRRASSSS